MSLYAILFALDSVAAGGFLYTTLIVPSAGKALAWAIGLSCAADMLAVLPSAIRVGRSAKADCAVGGTPR